MMLPEMTDLKTWANSLTIDFPTDDIPLLYNEDNWKDWADQLVQCTTFIQNNAPSPRSEDDWKKWAQRVFFCMNNN